MAEYATGWPLRAAVQVTRERRLEYRGVVLVAPGDRVEPGQIIAQGDGVPLVAGLRGRVARIEPEVGAVVQGVATVAGALWGLGRDVAGPLVALSPGSSRAAAAGSILIVPGELTGAIWQTAQAARVGGVFAATARPALLAEALGAEITSLVDGTATVAPLFSLALVQGFSARPPATDFWQALRERDGQPALLCPRTNLGGEARPTLCIALPELAAATMAIPDMRIMPGATVWVAGGEYDGAVGQVLAVCAANQPVLCGVRTAAACVRLPNGVEVILPLANLIRAG